jgi:hypothetical protein
LKMLVRHSTLSIAFAFLATADMIIRVRRRQISSPAPRRQARLLVRDLGQAQAPPRLRCKYGAATTVGAVCLSAVEVQGRCAYGGAGRG